MLSLYQLYPISQFPMLSISGGTMGCFKFCGEIYTFRHFIKLNTERTFLWCQYSQHSTHEQSCQQSYMKDTRLVKNGVCPVKLWKCHDFKLTSRNWLSYIDCLTLTVLHWLSYMDLSYMDCLTWTVLHGLSYMDCLTLTVLHWLSYIDCLTLTVLHWLSYIDCRTLTVLHWLS